MFELSHRLIGIYKTANATRSEFSHYRAPGEHHTDAELEGISIDNTPLHAVPA